MPMSIMKTNSLTYRVASDIANKITIGNSIKRIRLPADDNNNHRISIELNHIVVMNRLVKVLFACAMGMAMFSCGISSDESIAGKAISDAAKSVKADMEINDEEEFEIDCDPGPILYSDYYTLIQERRCALENAIRAVADEYGYDTDLKKRHNSYFDFSQKMSDEFHNKPDKYDMAKARKREADTTLMRVEDIIRANYQDPLLKAMKELDGVEFPVYYDGNYVDDVTANIMLTPTNYEYGTINVRVNMTLKNPSVSHKVFYVLEGLTTNMKKVEQFDTDDTSISGRRYNPGTRVYFDVALFNESLDCVGINITKCSTDGF